MSPGSEPLDTTFPRDSRQVFGDDRALLIHGNSELILIPSFPQQSTITKWALPPSRSYHERIGRSLPRRRRLRRGRGGFGAAGGFDGGVFGPLLAERARHACGWWRGQGGGIAGSSPGTVSGLGGAGAGASSIRAGSSWSGRGMMILSPTVRRSRVGDDLLVGRPEGLVIPARPVVEQRDRPEVLAAADRVECTGTDRESLPELESDNKPPPRA